MSQKTRQRIVHRSLVIKVRDNANSSNYGKCGRGQLKCDGTRAETRFRLSAKRTTPFKSAGASVQSTTGSRGVRISGSNAGYIMFRGSVKGFPFTSPPVRHRVASHFSWSLPTAKRVLQLNVNRRL